MELRGAERDGATRGVEVLRPARANGVEGPPVDPRRVRDAAVEVEAHDVRLKQLGHAANVIGMRMTGDDEVDCVDEEGLEILADAGRAGVDNGCVAALLDDRGVALADVEEADFQLCGIEASRREEEE